MEISYINGKFEKFLNENIDQYYYVVHDGNYTIDGHYYNSDIHAYTPEGDHDGTTKGWTSKKFNTIDELLNDLDNELLLTDEMEKDFENPETIEWKTSDTGLSYLQYEAQRDEDDYDEERPGGYSEYTVNYTIDIYKE